MQPSSVDVVIIGAGPYGLSLASHLSHLGIERRVFGLPMDAWRRMPNGMYLKSFGFATSIPSAEDDFALPDYCRARGREGFEPVALADFIEYGMSFQRQFVRDVEPGQVTNVRRLNGRFEVTIENGERIRARRVVVATGLSSFETIPAALSKLPAEFVSHTARRHEFGRFAGRDVTVVGAGQSALEAAALLHEHGAQVRLVARGRVEWATRAGNDRSWFEALRAPVTVMGVGRMHWVLQHAPALMRYVPTRQRVPFTRGYLGPLGAWWLRDRVEGKLPILEQTRILATTVKRNSVCLTVTGRDGAESLIETDHVIAGTGYAVDVDCLPFMSPPLALEIRRIERAPALSRHFEASVPGLYFVGPASAFSFGPLFRFVAGASYTVPVVARHLARTAGRRACAWTALWEPRTERMQ